MTTESNDATTTNYHNMDFNYDNDDDYQQHQSPTNNNNSGAPSIRPAAFETEADGLTINNRAAPTTNLSELSLPKKKILHTRRLLQPRQLHRRRRHHWHPLRTPHVRLMGRSTTIATGGCTDG
mmetsp:Transcript_15906/g.24018  ORF Transcript_15906/g.24018 Transcript_15906/m.24018 type:complete len:123 (+) Transcript_15906:155-523(+)